MLLVGLVVVSGQLVNTLKVTSGDWRAKELHCPYFYYKVIHVIQNGQKSDIKNKMK